MLFNLLKLPAKIAIRFYCKDIYINNPEFLKAKGPLLIACNHPNSFLDAVILATLFNKPIYSLARGDAFSNKFTSALLRLLNILPVYRISEGAENLNSNYDTFESCRNIFKKNGIVLIFSEGLCINEWKLRALKKGTARLAFSSWEEGINLTVLPTGINYHSFKSFGKNVRLQFGKPFTWKDLDGCKGDGTGIKNFNDLLKKELVTLVDHIEPHDKTLLASTFQLQAKQKGNWLLTVPAFAGKWLHAPLYFPVWRFTKQKAGKSDHFDSILIGLLFILYPILLLLLSFLCSRWGVKYALLPMVILPFCAWAYLQQKKPR